MTQAMDIPVRFRSPLRRSLLLRGGAVAGFFLAVVLGALALPEGGPTVSHLTRNLPASWAHPFGTNTLGRDMASRTPAALAVSVRFGLFAALISTAIAVVLGLLATTTV